MTEVKGIYVTFPSGEKSFVPCNPGEISDGYHTFDELYEHRCLLFAALMVSNPGISWYSEKHDDESVWDGWFIAGMNLEAGPITYHLSASMWDMLQMSKVKELEKAPKWDGHTSNDVLTRIQAWIWTR